jgi:hypothetical protein
MGCFRRANIVVLECPDVCPYYEICKESRITRVFREDVEPLYWGVEE